MATNPLIKLPVVPGKPINAFGLLTLATDASSQGSVGTKNLTPENLAKIAADLSKSATPGTVPSVVVNPAQGTLQITDKAAVSPLDVLLKGLGSLTGLNFTATTGLSSVDLFVPKGTPISPTGALLTGKITNSTLSTKEASVLNFSGALDTSPLADLIGQPSLYPSAGDIKLIP